MCRNLCSISMCAVLLLYYTRAQDDPSDIPISGANLLQEILESNDFTDVEKQLLKYIIFQDVKRFAQQRDLENARSDYFEKRSRPWSYRPSAIPIQTRVSFGQQLMRNPGGSRSGANILRYGRK